MDANEIIPENEKFYYKGNGDCPVKSIVGFSDIFRYKLLYMVGGWYSDFDVTCLKSFRSIDTPSTIIRPHETFGAASNICKFKRGDSILLDLYETTLKEVNADNCKWTKPLDIFRYKITEYSYNQYIIDDILLGKDSMVTDIQPLLNNDFLNVDVTNRYAIHWCKSAIKSGNWCSSHYYNIDDPFPGTLLSYLYTKYSIS